MVTCLFLSGCEDIKVIEVNGIETQVVIDESQQFDLEISGTKNTITVLENSKIRNIDMIGIKNSITIKSNTTIENFYLGGNDHTITIPKNSGIKFKGRTDTHTIIEQ